MTDPLTEHARGGDPGAFIDLVRGRDPELRRLAESRCPAGTSADEPLLRAYVEAFRELPGLGEDAKLGEWLADHVERACAEGAGAPARGGDFWARLAAALAAESPALAPPELPDRRFPVMPRLQRRRR